MLKWFKDKLGITMLEEVTENLKASKESLEKDVKFLQDIQQRHQDFIRNCTSVSSDINFRHDNDSIVFVAGRYKNKDYVKLFKVKHDNMNYLIGVLKSLDSTGRKGFYDQSLSMDIEAWIDRK